jgi:hypothetical protein
MPDTNSSTFSKPASVSLRATLNRTTFCRLALHLLPAVSALFWSCGACCQARCAVGAARFQSGYRRGGGLVGPTAHCRFSGWTRARVSATSSPGLGRAGCAWPAGLEVVCDRLGEHAGPQRAFREPVMLCTQTANEPSMRLAANLGFTKAERFGEYGAKQWFGVVPGSRGPAELVLDSADPAAPTEPDLPRVLRTGLPGRG